MPIRNAESVRAEHVQNAGLRRYFHTNPTSREILGQAASADPVRFSQRASELYFLVAQLDSLPPTKHVPSEVVAYATGLSIVTGVPFALVQHGISRSVGEKATILAGQHDSIAGQLGQEAPVEPLKTVTLRVGHQEVPAYFIVSGIGNFRVDDQTKQDLLPPIQKLLGTDTNVMRTITVNPPELDPRYLGAEAGIVGPFIETFGRFPVRGLFYYVPSDYEGFVAVAVSFTDTLIVQKSVLSLTINHWQENHLGIPFELVSRNMPTT